LATVNDAIRTLQRQFAEAEIGTARLDAELLVGHALGMSRTQLLANLREPIPDAQIPAVDALADRRLGGEPVAYILGRKEFLGHDFIVNPSVLTPRPETELLVEWAIRWLSQRPDASVIDVGTGSGAIAIGVALSTPPTVSTSAIDVSEDALAVARANADRLCPGRISFRTGDLLADVQGPIDLVLANLPYLRPDQIDGNRDLVAEPRLALDGGTNGVELIERILERAVAVAAPRFGMIIELDPDHANAVGALAAARFPTADVIIVSDLTGRDRFIAIERQETAP
jgi:release factor glutamine methyltransferase